MSDRLIEQIQEHRKTHPQIDELLNKLRLTREEYKKALAAISIRVPKRGSSYATTTNLSFNADVSEPSK